MHTLIENISGGTTRGAHRTLRPSRLVGHGFSHDPRIKITPSHTDHISRLISREPLLYAARLGSDVRLSRRERRIRPSRLVGHGFSHDPKIKITPSHSDYRSPCISREPWTCVEQLASDLKVARNAHHSRRISREPLPYAARLGSDVRLSRRERRTRPSRLVGHGF